MKYLGKITDAKDLVTKEYADSRVSVSASGTATDEIQYITVNGVEKKIAGGGGGSASIEYLSAILPSTGWVKDDTKNWYEKTVSVVGLLATDKPFVDLDLSDLTVSEDIEAANASYANIFNVVANNDSATFSAGQAPTTEMTIQFAVLRSSSGGGFTWYTPTVGITGWTKDDTANWYTKTITVAGIRAGEELWVDIQCSDYDTSEEVEAGITAWANMFSAVATAADTVVIRSAQVPTAEITLQLGVFR